MNTGELFQLALLAVVVNNVILSRTLGICQSYGTVQSRGLALNSSIATAVTMLLATVITWPINVYVLIPLNIEYLRIIVFVVTVAALAYTGELFLQKYFPIQYATVGQFVTQSAIGCAVIGVALIATMRNPVTNDFFSFVEACVLAIASGAGFVLVSVLMAAVQHRLRHAPIPASVKGLPLFMIVAGLMALALNGFVGFHFFQNGR